MKKILIATTALLAVSLTACADDDETKYYDETPQEKSPTQVEQPVRLKVPTYENDDSQVTKVIIDGTECVIWSTYQGGGGLDCNWNERKNK